MISRLLSLPGFALCQHNSACLCACADYRLRARCTARTAWREGSCGADRSSSAVAHGGPNAARAYGLRPHRGCAACCVSSVYVVCCKLHVLLLLHVAGRLLTLYVIKLSVDVAMSSVACCRSSVAMSYRKTLLRQAVVDLAHHLELVEPHAAR